MPGQDTTVQEAMTLCCVARHLPINVPPSTKEYNWEGKLYKMLQVKYSNRLHAHHFDKDYYFKVIHQGHLTSGIMPGSSPVPIIVYVLPVPVCRHNIDKYQPMTELETSSQLFNLQ